MSDSSFLSAPKLRFGGVDRCANARNPRSIPLWRIPEAQQNGPLPLRSAGPLRHRAGLHNFETPPHLAISTRLSSARRLRRNDRFTLASGLCQRHVEWHQNLYHQPTRHFPPVRAPASSCFGVQPNRLLRVQAVASLHEGLRSHFNNVQMKSGLEPANLEILSVPHCAQPIISRLAM